MAQLTYITSNDNKFREAAAILPGLERMKLELPEIQSTDLHEIISAKLDAAVAQVSDASERILIVEDGANYFDGCGNLPGPFVKFFIEELGGAAGLYKFAQAFGVTRGRVVLGVGLLDKGRERHFFEGEVHGKIVAPRGASNFGFDPIFQPDGFTKTFAEMTSAEKNAISHRALALQKVKNYLDLAYPYPPRI
jgi:inosine triphosphate pyrophosphatase